MKRKTAETTTEGGWSSGDAELPLDVWGDIFSRLPFKQVLVCRCICRAWNALLARVYHPDHNTTTPATTLLCYRLPWIRPLRNYLTLAELRNGASYTTTVKRIEDCCNHVAGVHHTSDDGPVISCHGLVCFTSNRGSANYMSIYVGNPLLKEQLLVVRPPEIKIKTEEWQLSHLAGFGFSPGADCYKILIRFYVEKERSHFLICTVGEGSRSSRGKHQVCLPSWRRLLSFYLHFPQHSCQLGSYLNAGIHWLAYDCSHKYSSVFISRLDLDTEQFGRVELPQSPDFSGPTLGSLSLCVSDGHLIICADLRRQEIIDIWVMNELNLWTKNMVVRSPIITNCMQRMEVLNYGKVEAAAREGAVAEVMLLVENFYLYACTTRGRHVRELDFLPRGEIGIVHIPSLLSIKDVAEL